MYQHKIIPGLPIYQAFHMGLKNWACDAPVVCTGGRRGRGRARSLAKSQKTTTNLSLWAKWQERKPFVLLCLLSSNCIRIKGQNTLSITSLVSMDIPNNTFVDWLRHLKSVEQPRWIWVQLAEKKSFLKMIQKNWRKLSMIRLVVPKENLPESLVFHCVLLIKR